jgi:hypothetical protein
MGPPFGEVEMAFPVDLADLFASMDDLEEVKRALIREASIRHAMGETGESREIVTEMIDSIESMGQEAVLELTEGEPTTLAEALQRYVDTLEQAASEDETIRADDVCGALSALLAYPWPGVPDADRPVRTRGSLSPGLTLCSLDGKV